MMLRVLSWIAIALGALALLVGGVTLLGARDWRGDWLLLPTLFGVNAMVGGVLTLLLGAIGLGTAKAGEKASDAAAGIRQAAFDLQRQFEEQALSAEMDRIRARLAAEHGERVADLAVKHMVEARRRGSPVSEGWAVSAAQGQLRRSERG